MRMTKPMHDDLEEKPLDPEMEKVRRKLARLMVVSIGIMLVGVMAVLVAVVYKSGPGPDSTGVARASIELPDDFAVTDMAVSESRIAFFGMDGAGDRRVVAFDLSSGRLVADHTVR